MVSKFSNQFHSELISESVHYPKVERVLRWFEKKGNELVGEKTLKNVTVEHLQKLFDISSDNPMYDCYPLLTTEQIEYFENLLDLTIDSQLYDYFLECDAV